MSDQLSQSFEGMLRAIVFDAVTQAMSNQQKPLVTKPLFKYLNTSEAADFLGKTPNALRVMVFKDQIKCIKKDSRLMFREADLIEYLESGQRSSKAQLAAGFEDAIKTKGAKA